MSVLAKHGRDPAFHRTREAAEAAYRTDPLEAYGEYAYVIAEHLRGFVVEVYDVDEIFLGALTYRGSANPIL